MKTLRFLLTVMILALSVVAFVYASKKPTTKSDGPYTATCVAERDGLSVSGKAKVEGKLRVVNGSYFMGFTKLNPYGTIKSTSDHFLNGKFTMPYRQKPMNLGQGRLAVSASAWGSATDGQWYDGAAVSDKSKNHRGE